MPGGLSPNEGPQTKVCPQTNEGTDDAGGRWRDCPHWEREVQTGSVACEICFSWYGLEGFAKGAEFEVGFGEFAVGGGAGNDTGAGIEAGVASVDEA